MKILLANFCVICLFYLTVFVDVFSGILILGEIIPEGGAGSPSQFFRLFLLILLFRVVMFSRRFLYIISFFFGYIFSVELFSFAFHESVFGLLIGFIYGGKIIYLLLVYYSLKILTRSKYLTISQFEKHLKRYILLTSLLLLIPFLLNIGNSTYVEGTSGFKGFFSSGNGLGVFLGTSLLLLVYYFKLHKNIYHLFKSILTLFATIIIGSKTALFFTLTGTVALFFSFKRYFSLLLIVSGISIAMKFLPFLTAIFEVMFDVILFRYNNSENLLSYAMSHRDIYFLEAINNYKINGLFALRIFFGFGVYTSFRAPSNNHLSFDTLESDFADLFFMYGGIFLLYYLIVISHIIYISLKTQKYFLGLIFFFLILHSLFMGHVIFNGMSGIMLPIIAFLITEGRNFKSKSCRVQLSRARQNSN